MKRSAIVLSVLVGGVMLFGFSGCGKKEVKQTTLPVGPQPPAWVMKGTGVFSGDKGRVFRAVGTVSGVKNIGLARTAVGDDARKELAKLFNTYVASLTKIYRRSTTADDPNVSSEEQDIMEASKIFTKMKLSGVQIVEYWYDAQNNTWYALAELDLNAFKDFASQHKQLSDRVRDFIRNNAEAAFDDLAAEEEKH